MRPSASHKMGTSRSNPEPTIALILLQFLHLHVAVANEFLGVIAATMNLKCDATTVWMSNFGLFPFHDFDAVDPGGDVRWFSNNAGA